MIPHGANFFIYHYIFCFNSRDHKDIIIIGVDDSKETLVMRSLTTEQRVRKRKTQLDTDKGWKSQYT